MDIGSMLLDVLQFGFPYGILALGVFISFRILDFADMTTEGTFVCGGALALVMISLGVNPWLATIIAMIGGFLAGTITGLLHTKLKVPGLLAGIITMTGLFSINMVVLGLTKQGVPFSQMFNSYVTLSYNPSTDADPTIFGLLSFIPIRRIYIVIISLAVITAIITTLVYFFFGTEFGMSMRATGMNQKMARAQGINTDMHIIIGLGISNALIALSAALGAQRDLTISTTSGTGMLVIGLASIIIGEAIFGKKSFMNWIISVVCGAVVYYLIIAIAIALGLPSHFLKLLYAIIITLILVFPIAKSAFMRWYNSPKEVDKREKKAKEKKKALDAKILAMSQEEKDAYYANIEAKEAKKKAKEENKKAKEEAKLQKENEKMQILEEKLKNKPVHEKKISPEKAAKLDEERIKKEMYVKQHGILHVSHVVKKFNPTGNPEDLKIALNNLSVSVKPGEFVTIIGGNGSGKSTFFNTVSGVYIPEDGNIIINGEDVTKLKEYKRSYFIGRVAQDPYQGTAPDMSILENMNIAMRRNQKKTLKWGFNKKDTLLFAERLALLGLGLENRMTAKIGTLSGGQRQAVTLLMATLQRPDVLFLDEHTAALDPKTAKTVLNITDKVITENNLTAVMVTHNMKDAIKYGNRLLMFNNGKIIYDVSGEEKANLTVEDLLKKFEGKVEFSDKDILATD